MIQIIANKYKKHTCWLLFFAFYLQLVSPVLVKANVYNNNSFSYNNNSFHNRAYVMDYNGDPLNKKAVRNAVNRNQFDSRYKLAKFNKIDKQDIGGPNSPEASSFKGVGTNNLVNLFTGDFSYSVPLLDVGGYPVNLFYAGGITMDQEASWVGLGWNINPGTVTRNMRGVPDDFDGTDILIQQNNVRPNITWGAELGIDLEKAGVKKPKLGVGGTVGFSYNNYLGPAIDLGVAASINLSIVKNVKFEKSATPGSLGLKLAVGAKLDSRGGFTLAPSLNASLFSSDSKSSLGIGLSTSYNSRVGIKELTLSSSTASDKFKLGSQKTDDGGALSLGSTSISFARPSYMPTIRVPMLSKNLAGKIEFGVGFGGFRGAISGSGYYSSSEAANKTIKKPLVGYMYSEKAMSKPTAVMDFNRLGDAEVTPNTPIISATQYTYDIFSIQGEGTGGSIRAYRGDLGFMKDNVTTSKDKNTSLGADIGLPGHFGFNFNTISTPTKVGNWEGVNNSLNKNLLFQKPKIGSAFENIYFRNPGESSVISSGTGSEDGQLKRIGEDNLVAFQLGGVGLNPSINSALNVYNKKDLSFKKTVNVSSITNSLTQREKRTQVITMFTAKEASEIGLEKKIRNYDGTFNPDKTFKYTEHERIDAKKLGHHISEIDVLEQTGMRYVYGLPVYSLSQVDYTFSVSGKPDADNIVSYLSDEPTLDSRHVAEKSLMEGNVQVQSTPAYASSFLLTGLISPDYVDVDNNGITENDLGTAVKFDYQKSTMTHKWRTPRRMNQTNTASFNEGIRSVKKDNKAIISYGEREVWYLQAIESKSMVAIFKTAGRDDAKGVKTALDGSINEDENANKRLDQIDLYTKAEIQAKGINNAIPIKTVHFIYDYSLCNGTPDNKLGQGKLTLRSVYFSYNGQNRQKKNKYLFHYGSQSTDPAPNTDDNPNYAYNASDRWGTYKNKISNPLANDGKRIDNMDHPFTSTNKTANDKYAGAWSLKKILLPSGGQMEVKYEAKDYAYVQDKRACDMFNIAGLGQGPSSIGMNNQIYDYRGKSYDNRYLYVSLPQPLQSSDLSKIKAEIKEKYLAGIEQLAIKVMVQMPDTRGWDGWEPLTVYADIDYSVNDGFGLCPNSNYNDPNPMMFIRLKERDEQNPIAQSAIGYLTENLSCQAFGGCDQDIKDIGDFFELLKLTLSKIKEAFKNVNEQMRSAGKAQVIDLSKSFIRLSNSTKFKYGGGVRVKQVLIKDNWNAMKKQYTSVYGQDYDYTTTEKINDVEQTISSGVASYEPSVGSEENPFRKIISFDNKLPMASAQYGAIEMPMLDAFYPSPSVGYSKVTVRSIHRKGSVSGKSVRSGIGKQVTEYYTAKEYPSYSVNTVMTDLEGSQKPFFSFFYKELMDYRTISQGFLVETNDMHGKIKRQAAYSESDEKTPISYSMHTYKNTGKNGLNDKFDFVDNMQGGKIISGNMGIDAELMTDVREFSIVSKGLDGQAQVDFYSYVPPVLSFFLWGLKTKIDNKYRAVTTTKLINYHAVEDETTVMDKGSIVSTKTIAYDGETGSPIVTETANEFNDPIYNVSYPAHWAYSGAAPAYKNIGRQFAAINFYDGRIINLTAAQQNEIFESGDELYITVKGTPPETGCFPASPDVVKLWVFDINKNTSPLTNANKNLVFIDENGDVFTKNGVSFKIIRSGNRNNIGLTVFSATTMANPIQNNVLTVNNAANVVTASAVDYKEKWQIDPDVFKKYKMQCELTNPVNMIVNPGFEDGSIGFYSAHVNYCGDTLWDHNGRYCLHNDATGGHGNYMQVNAAHGIVWEAGKSGQPGKPNENYDIVVQPHTYYDFSATFGHNNSENSSIISLEINDIQVPNATTYYNTTGSGWYAPFTYRWYSDNATTAKITLTNHRGNDAGNDFVLDDLYFAPMRIQVPVYYEDCNGSFLETKVNPYLKGLIGNLKPYRSYTYYGDRNEKEVNPNLPTNIRKNGYIANYTNFWNFENNTNLVPDYLNTKWVFNSELTKTNAKGQELETRDALDRYTAAQHGYAKNMPVAVTQNARYGNSFAESFEDNDYKEQINPGATNICVADKYINFDDLSNSHICKAAGINAHTGKKVIKINSNSSVTKTIPIKAIPLSPTTSVPPPPNQDNVDLSFTPNTTKKLSNDYGLNYDYSNINNTIINDNGNSDDVNFSLQDLSDDFDNISLNEHSFNYNIRGVSNDDDLSTYKVKIVNSYYKEFSGEDGIYTCRLTYKTDYHQEGEAGLIDYGGMMNYKVNIYRLDGVLMASNYSDFDVIPPYTITPDNYHVDLTQIHNIPISICNGIYKVEIILLLSHKLKAPEQFYRDDIAKISFTNASNPNYKTLSTAQGCPYTKPIAADNKMTNSIFTLPAGKRMQFSAWVRQDGTNTNAVTYDKAGVQLNINGASTQIANLNPVGSIIEGWQKVEGEFTVPAITPDIAAVDLILSNTGLSNVYFDDIRIHPYNANMKSYVYDPVTLRLTAELDENNYATFYEYDEEGQLVRLKKETIEGIKTLKETRSATQKSITQIQP
ncbi:MAG: hypothetical protein V4556_08390 [Bacteroidota bacterium]